MLLSLPFSGYSYAIAFADGSVKGTNWGADSDGQYVGIEEAG